MKQNMDTLLKDYIENAIIQGEATLDGDYKKCNKAAKKLINIYKVMEHNDKLAVQMLEILLKDEHINVKICASAHALGLNVNINLAISTLEQISTKPELGILGFNAEMSLKTYYKQGYLKFY